MMNLNKDEARLYNFVIEIINQVMDNYGYDIVLGKEKSSKCYTSDFENIYVFNENDTIYDKAELISLGYYLFKRLGLEDIELSINKNDELCDLLDILDIEYLTNLNDNDLVWNYVFENVIIGSGSNNSFKLDIKKLINQLMKKINIDALQRIIDVNIKAVSEEELYHALKVAQDLRLNNINVLINKKNDSKFDILLKDEDLNKGIITVRDNHVNEEFKIDESEIVDYILGNI